MITFRPWSPVFDLCVTWHNVPMCDSARCHNIKGLCSTQISPRTSRPHCQPGEALRLTPVKSRPHPLMENGSSAAQFLELHNKSPWYIELSASPALVSVCIGCSLSLQLSAWGGTVNDGFVLRSPFVLSWFLEQRKQAWNLFYPPSEKNGRHSKFVSPQFSNVDKGEWIRFCFAPLCLLDGFALLCKDGTFSSNWRVAGPKSIH